MGNNRMTFWDWIKVYAQGNETLPLDNLDMKAAFEAGYRLGRQQGIMTKGVIDRLMFEDAHIVSES